MIAGTKTQIMRMVVRIMNANRHFTSIFNSNHLPKTLSACSVKQNITVGQVLAYVAMNNEVGLKVMPRLRLDTVVEM